MLQSANLLSTRRRLLKASAALGAGVGLGLSNRSVLAADTTVKVLAVEDPFFYALRDRLPDCAAETGIKVELESLSYDALQARLVTSFVSKKPDADVITVDQMWAGQYLDNGWVSPLDDYIAKDKSLDLKDFIPQVLYSSNLWRGHFVTLPIAAYAQGTIYRKDVFEKFGIGQDFAKQDWTWDRYIAIIKQIQGQDFGGKKMFGTVVCGSQPTPIVHMFTQIAASFGARWFKEFPQAPWDFTPAIGGDAMKKSVAFYKNLYQLSPPEAINYVWFDAGTRFAKGDIGMFYWWTPYFYLVKNSGYMTGEKSSVMDLYGTAPLPAAAGVPQAVSLGGWSLGLPSTSPKKDAAFEFIKWAISAKTQKKMALDGKYNYQFSDFARRSLYSDPEIRQIYPYLDTQLAMMEQGDGKIARPPVPVYTSLENILGLQLNSVLSGSTDADAAIEEIGSQFETTLQGNGLLPYSGQSYDDTLDQAKAVIARLA